MRDLKFSKNWNGKLNNRMFTTIRDYSQYNDETMVLGGSVKIMFKDEHIVDGVVIDKVDCKFGLVPRWLLQADTGYQLEESRNVFSHFLKCDIVHLDQKRVFVFLIKVVNRVKFVPYENN